MASDDSRKWLLLIHQIPPKPNALRVKIWRRLQQIGAVAIKQSVYVLPFSDQAREDFGWTLKEIIDGGGDGSISEARLLDGLTDDQIISMFLNARGSDYEKFIQDVTATLAEWSSGRIDLKDPAHRIPAQLSKLSRRLDEIMAIDFFKAPERATAELRLKELGNLLAGPSTAGISTKKKIGNLTGKTWVTRGNIFVDRIACGWLIRRFADPDASFKFVSDKRHSPKPDEIRFDMFDGEFTHEGDRCTFEVMIQRLRLRDPALASMAEIIHDIDLKDGKYDRNETPGFQALLSGLVETHSNDHQRMEEGARLFENLYAYLHRHQ